MCILDILRLHISHNYKNNKRKHSKAKSECTDMSMINWSRKKALTKDERSKKLLLQISDFDNDYLPSLSDSICCSEYIINGGYCSKQHLYKEDDEDKKPEWLKQWTISKGWMHDRSHMLSLGVGSLDSSNIILDQTPRELDTASKTEDSSSNENDLISIIELESTTSKKDNNTYNTDKSGSCTKNDIDFDKIEIDKTDIYSQLNINYRRTFPVVHTDDKHFDTLKKYFTPNENEIQYTRIIFPSRQKLFKKSNQLKKFGKYKTFDDLTSIQNEEEQKQSRKRNPKGFSLANFRSNIQQDTIYECSEDSFSLYNNPIYEPIHTDNIELLEGERDISTYQSFNNDTNCQYQRYLNNDLNTNKLLPKDTKKSGSFKSKLSTEKYIIRHIRIRIMMTLRLRKFQRIYRKRIRSEKKVMCSNAGKKRNNFIKVCSESADVNLMRHDILKVHEEQRKIGNGETSLKIQNLRYGRLNVLRWLLWESQTQTQSQTASIGEMPALERDRSTSSALALHYAAARGCLDCVRLLVDSSTDLSANTQMDNDVTPVYLAAQEGHLEVLKFLVLEAGGSLYVRAKDGMAPLHAASQMGCLNCVKWMIQEQGVDPNLRDGDGATPLHFAASRGHLETVRWLLRHGARLSLDKYGKSPINDAAENQQVECLNVLVQHGTTPDYNDSDRSTKNTCSCQRKPDAQNRNHSSDCNSCVKNSTEPFYLHPPTINSTRTNTLEAPHAPQDGLYINPMNNHRHSTSSSSGSCSGDSMNGESFYLHNPQEVIYNRVKDLFESSTMNRHQPMSALTVKVEVHSSSSGAGSDENLSSSDLSERSGDHDHDYEDIYMARDESKNKDRTSGIRSRSRDSGSHSRSGSASSSNSGCNVVVTKVTKDGKNKESKNEIRKTNEFLPKPQKYEKPAKKEDKNSQESGLSSSPSDMYSEEENEKVKLAARHSLQPKSNNNNRLVKRVVSVPGDICPPPPPPPPPGDTKGDDKNDNKTEYDVEIITERTVRPSDVLKGMHRSISTISAAKRLNSSCSDLTIISLNTETDEEKHGPNLVNKQRVLPFIPPSFPGSTDSNNLIKPSEYLRSISDKRSSVSSVKSSDYEETIIVTEEKKDEVIIKPFNGPPPPPLPPASDAFPAIKPKDNDTDANKKQTQPLSAISIHDLNSVQLRRTDKMLASKTFSAPTRSMSLQCLQSESYIAQKTDLIAELKMSKDITGIKKMKVERNKVQEKQEKEMFTEISKQFTATNFVEKIPDKDNTGNIIPAWKRQMLAKKAAERARKELEEQLQKEAEEKRLQAIPQWKRQLLAKKEETENKIKNTIYTPKVVDDVRTVKHDLEECWRQHSPTSEEKDNKENKPEIVIDPPKEDNPKSEEDTNIIPWRAQLRKTNSKLNLLD